MNQNNYKIMESKEGIERTLVGVLIEKLELIGEGNQLAQETAKEIVTFLEDEGNLNLHPSRPSDEEIEKEAEKVYASITSYANYSEMNGIEKSWFIKCISEGMKQFAQKSSNKPLLNDEEIEKEAEKIICQYPHVHYITDENRNEWKVIETSDLPEILRLFAQQSSGVNKELLEGLKECVKSIEWAMDNTAPRGGADMEAFFNVQMNPLELARNLINKLEKK